MASERPWLAWAVASTIVLLVIAVLEGSALATAHRERDEARARLERAQSNVLIHQRELQEAERGNVALNQACARVVNEYLHEIQALQVFAAKLYANGPRDVLGLEHSLLGLELSVIADTVRLPRGFDFETYLQLALGQARSGVLEMSLSRCGLQAEGDFDNVHPNAFTPAEAE